MDVTRTYINLRSNKRLRFKKVRRHNYELYLKGHSVDAQRSWSLKYSVLQLKLNPSVM